MSPSPFLTSVAPVCPPELIDLANQGPRRTVAIAAAGAALPMQAAHEAAQLGFVEPLFVGVAADIRREADALDWDISGFEIIEASSEADAGLAAASACGEGRADVLMKGHLHTDQFMKAALKRDAGLRTGRRLVHVFHMSHPGGGRPLLLSDAAVNVSPDLNTRKDAIRVVVAMLKRLGHARPKVAILSATESVIESVPSSGDADTLAQWATAEIEDADFAGPLAMDGVLSAQAARIKSLDGPVPGHADAIIFPDIVSGNAVFKSLVYLSGACAAGVVMGAAVPILLTSRADPPAARLASMALAAITTEM